MLKNKISEAVQIGALGIPMIFNNVLNDRSLEEAHAPARSTIPTSARTPATCR